MIEAPGAKGSQHLYEGCDVQAIAARWDARAQCWDAELADPACHLNEDDAYHRFLDSCRKVIAERSDFCARHGLIDAGCGTGLVLAEVISSFAWGVGIDISREMLNRARTKYLKGVQFVLGDCFKLSALCLKAGAVVSRGVLLSHYGTEQGTALLREARAALVPGGFAIFDFLNAAGRGGFAHVPQNKTYFTPVEAGSMARNAGFSSVRVLGERKRRVLVLLVS